MLKEFIENRNNFLINVMNKPDYLEDISGISDLINEINLNEVEFDEEIDDF